MRLTRFNLILLSFTITLLCFTAIASAQKSHKKPVHSKSTRAARIAAEKRLQWEKRKKLRSKLWQLHKQKLVVRRQLGRTEAQAHSVRIDLYAYDNRLVAVRGQLRRTEENLSSAEDRQVALAKALQASQKNLVKDRQQLRQRLRAMYMEGDTPLLSVLFGTSSSGDIASRAYLVERVAKADHVALDHFKATLATVASQKREADQLVTRISDLKQGQVQQRATLSTVREQKAEALAQLRDKAGHLQSMLDEFESDESEIQREIIAAEDLPGNKGPMHPFTGHFIWPVRGPITSPFGERYHPILHRVRMHTGIDIGVPWGTPIKAAGTGVVIASQYMGGYGNVVIIDHGGGISTVYGHCSELFVRVGEHVGQGQHIANVGATGLATGPHLHFEVRVKGHPVNPLGWL